MGRQQIFLVRKYLYRYDEILCTMSDKMLNLKTTNNITIDFIEAMIPHHEAAICMSENLLKYTKCKPLIDIANNIISTQKNGICQMKDIAKTMPRFLNQPKDVSCYMKEYLEITQNMISKMKNSPRSINIDLNFINEMIPHHEGAICMSKNVLNYRIDPRLRNIANGIIKEQTEGISKLEKVKCQIV